MPETVVLLHGIGGTKLSMAGMARALRGAGYTTLALNYPSRTAGLRDLSGFVASQLARRVPDSERLHFVTHSMGGLVTAELLERGPIDPARIGRVVMVAPPLRGSEVADGLSRLALYRLIMGPAAMELTTAARRSAVEPGFTLGVIAGSSGWVYPLGGLFLPTPHDGRVTVAATKIPGLTGHIVVPGSHDFLMNRRDVQRQTLHFLQHGAFIPSA